MCEATSGHPQPSLSWSHPELSPRDLVTRVSVMETRAVLSLGHVTRDMAGVYTCTGDNGYSHQPAQASVQLQVQCKYNQRKGNPRDFKMICCRPS